MIHKAQVHTHGYTTRRWISFDHIRVSLAAGARGGVCRFEGVEPVDVPLAALSEVSRAGAPFSVLVTDAAAGDHLAVMADGLTTQFPHGADVFIYREQPNGFWAGWTVSMAFGRLVVRPYECDPV